VKRETRELPLEKRIEIIIAGLEKDLQGLPYVYPKRDVAVIEQPQLWGAYKSVASAQSGALLSLHILVGALFWYCNKNFFRTKLIPVSVWKGQLPKRVTKKRMETKYDVKFATDDESDACGLGDYYLTKIEGKLKK